VILRKNLAQESWRLHLNRGKSATLLHPLSHSPQPREPLGGSPERPVRACGDVAGRRPRGAREAPCAGRQRRRSGRWPRAPCAARVQAPGPSTVCNARAPVLPGAGQAKGAAEQAACSRRRKQSWQRAAAGELVPMRFDGGEARESAIRFRPGKG